MLGLYYLTDIYTPFSLNLCMYFFFQMNWFFGNWPYDLILLGVYVPDFVMSHFGLIFDWADQCNTF